MAYIIQIQIDEYIVNIHFADEGLLNEAKRRWYDVGHYKVAVDKASIPHDKDNIHVYVNRDEIVALNFDGTSRHGFHNVAIPNKVQKFLASQYPNVVIPPGGIVESTNKQISYAVEIDDKIRQRIEMLLDYLNP